MLDTNLTLAFQRVGTEFKTVKSLLAGNDQGDLSGLSTADKTSLLAAVNEVNAAVSAVTGGVVYRGTLPATANLNDTPAGNGYDNLFWDGLGVFGTVPSGSLFRIVGSGNLTVIPGTVNTSGSIPVNDGDDIIFTDDFAKGTITGDSFNVIDNSDAQTDTDDLPEGSSNQYFTEARALATLLAGYTQGPGGETVVAGDSLLEAIQKLAGNLAVLTTGVGDTNTDFVTVFEGALV